MRKLHGDRLDRRDGVDAFDEHEILHQTDANFWVALVYKGYQEAAEFLDVILSKKNPVSRTLRSNNFGEKFWTYRKYLESNRFQV